MLKKFTNYLIATFLLFTFTNLKAQDELIFKVNAPSTLSATYEHGTGFTSSQSTSGLATANRWGGTLLFGQEVTGDVVVIRDTSRVDTVAQHGCNATLKAGLDVRGKIVLVRRGTCGFSIKAFNAAYANGAKAVIVYNNVPNVPVFYMSPSRPQADSVKVPCIFTSREIGEAIRNAVDGGQTVNITIRRPALFRPHTNYNYTTPVKETQNTRGYMGLALANATTTEKYKPFFTAVITEPDGKKVTVKGVGPDTLKANLSSYIQSDSTYKPSKIGDYKVVFTNSITTDSIRDSFRISDFTYAEDRGPINNWRSIDSATFVKGGLKYDVGHIYYTGISADKATHASFALHNPADFPKNDEFIFVLYPFPASLSDKFDNAGITYDDLNGTEVATGIYKIKGTEKPDSLLVVEFPTPATLKDTTAYLLMMRYDGTTAGTAKVPQYSTAGAYTNYFVNTDMLVIYNATANAIVFFSGWSDGIKYVTRLHMFGFGFRTAIENNLPAWAENTINVFPNPINDGILNLDFKLEKMNEEVSITINDMMGRVLKTVKLKNVQSGAQQINVSELANGHYFAKIVGKDGWRTKAFHIER
jgi:hypothetical protein